MAETWHNEFAFSAIPEERALREIKMDPLVPRPIPQAMGPVAPPIKPKSAGTKKKSGGNVPYDVPGSVAISLASQIVAQMQGFKVAVKKDLKDVVDCLSELCMKALARQNDDAGAYLAAYESALKELRKLVE